MRAVIQRVTKAKVELDGQPVSQIGLGFLVLLGVIHDDTANDVSYVVSKLVNLRIFEDDKGKLNLNLKETGGSVLLISQFTLYADTRKGRRPSFTQVADPATAEKLYLETAKGLRKEGINTELGVFGAKMAVSLVNDGPVTLIVDSKKTG